MNPSISAIHIVNMMVEKAQNGFGHNSLDIAQFWTCFMSLEREFPTASSDTINAQFLWKIMKWQACKIWPHALWKMAPSKWSINWSMGSWKLAKTTPKNVVKMVTSSPKTLPSGMLIVGSRIFPKSGHKWPMKWPSVGWWALKQMAKNVLWNGQQQPLKKLNFLPKTSLLSCENGNFLISQKSTNGPLYRGRTMM